MRLVSNIVRKDWREHSRTVIVLTMISVACVWIGLNKDLNFMRTALFGISAGAAFAYAQFCFGFERQRGTIQLLLSLPIRPFELVAAKYVALYSMVLFTVNVPILVIADLRTAIIANSLALLFATCCMAAPVIIDAPAASMLPIWLLLAIPPGQYVAQRFFAEDLKYWTGWFISHAVPLSFAGFALTAVIALGSCWIFSALNQAV